MCVHTCTNVQACRNVKTSHIYVNTYAHAQVCVRCVFIGPFLERLCEYSHFPLTLDARFPQQQTLSFRSGIVLEAVLFMF